MRIASTAILALSVFSSTSFAAGEKGDAPAHTAEEAGRRRAERQRPGAEIAPSSAGSTLVGKKGFDKDGRPTQHVDRAALRALLFARRFADLTAQVEMLQSAFEADARGEEWPVHATMAFDSAESDLLPLLDAWVEATPKSFAPYLVRGSHRVSLGYTRRGGHWAKDTHETDFAAMEHTHRQAQVDLERALEMRPKLVAARTELLIIAKASAGQEAITHAGEAAVAACPTCLLPRISYMRARAPRWGGSYEAMATVAKAAPVAKNPRLRLLPGFISLDKANMLQHDKKADEALVEIERAVALGEYWEFLYERARVLDDKDAAAARRDVDHALALNPFEPDLLYESARVASYEKSYERAGRDLMAALRIDPTDQRAKDAISYTVSGLVYAANQARLQNRLDDAMRIVELATDLAPRHRDGQGLHIWLLTHGPDGKPLTDVDALRTGLRDTPDDLRAHQRVDYLLAQKRRFPEVVEVWNGYLAKHPDDGRALLERGGAHYNLGHKEAAVADARRACELGVSEGCARAKLIQP